MLALAASAGFAQVSSGAEGSGDIIAPSRIAPRTDTAAVSTTTGTESPRPLMELAGPYYDVYGNEYRTDPTGSVATPIGTTYSVHPMLGADLNGNGFVDCRFIFADPPPGAEDDVVTYDGLVEAIRTNILGTVPMVIESKVDYTDGTHLIVIDTSVTLGRDLFPGGVIDDASGTTLTDACFTLGLVDQLDWPGMDTVTEATLSFLRAGSVVNGPFDVTTFFMNPWNGFFGFPLRDVAGSGIDQVHLEIVIEKAPEGLLRACCLDGACYDDVEEISCNFQGGIWTAAASCGDNANLPSPMCDQVACQYDNGTPLDDRGAPLSRYAPDAGLAAGGADDFVLTGAAGNSCWADVLRFWVTHDDAGVDPAADYQGVNVTIYANTSTNVPGGRPLNDGSHQSDLAKGGVVFTQTIPMSSVAVAAVPSLCLTNQWRIEVPVSIVLNKDTRYWLEIQPIIDASIGKPSLLLSNNNTAQGAMHIAGELGRHNWTPINGNSDACGIDTPPAGLYHDLAFQLLGEKALAPPNDNCADAISVGEGLIPFTNIGANTDGRDEPAACDFFNYTQIDADVWFDHVAECTGTLTVDLCESDNLFDTKLAMYAGCGTCPPRGMIVACDEDFCGRQSLVSHQVNEGECYTIRAGGYQGDLGTGILSVNCVPPPPPVGACCDQVICIGTVTEPACNDAGGIWNEGESCVSFTCSVPPPPNDECSNCIPLSTDIPYEGVTFGATGTDASSCSEFDSADIWHCWTANCSGTTVVSLCGGSVALDTTLSVFDSCGGAELACNDDDCGLRSKVAFQATEGETYYIRVAGFGGAVGAYTLNIEPCADACCTTSGFYCATLPYDECLAAGGIPHGPGSECGRDENFNGIIDICEEPVGAWFFKDFNGNEPGGFLPDFDQNKDYDNADGDDDPTTGADPYYCGPTAVANSLWWFNDKYPGADIVPALNTKIDLVEELAGLMGTGGTALHPSPGGHIPPYTGTFVDDMQLGIDMYLTAQGLSGLLSAQTVPEPPLDVILNKLIDGEGITLLLGFYAVTGVDPVPGGFVVNWRRGGGHYVAVAGVDGPNSLIALSDPDADRAEQSGVDFVRGGDHDHDGDGTPGTSLPFGDAGYDHTVHNDKGLASHDVYDAGPSFAPGFDWILAIGNDPLAYGLELASRHEDDAGGSFDTEPTFASDDLLAQTGYPPPAAGQIYTVVEQAVIVAPVAAQGCCLPDRTCSEMLPVECRDLGGTPLGIDVPCEGDNDGDGADDACGGCPDATIASAVPLSGTIDARQPNTPGVALPRQGIGAPIFAGGAPAEPIVITLSPPVAGAETCFSLCETAADSLTGPNSIATATDLGNGDYELILDHAITAGAVTTIQYQGDGSFVVYTSHPANADGDSASGPPDILKIIDYLNGVATSPWGLYSEDIDHSGQLQPPDILRVIDLLNGAGAFDVWLNSPLPTNPNCPTDPG